MPVAKKSAALAEKSYDMIRPTFPKVLKTIETFNFQQILLLDFCQWTKTKNKVVLWETIKLIPVTITGPNVKKNKPWAKLYCKVSKF